MSLIFFKYEFNFINKLNQIVYNGASGLLSFDKINEVKCHLSKISHKLFMNY